MPVLSDAQQLVCVNTLQHLIRTVTQTQVTRLQSHVWLLKMRFVKLQKWLRPTSYAYQLENAPILPQ
jgi:hypothetical protein